MAVFLRETIGSDSGKDWLNKNADGFWLMISDGQKKKTWLVHVDFHCALLITGLFDAFIGRDSVLSTPAKNCKKLKTPK